MSNQPLPPGWEWASLGDLVTEGPSNGYSPKTGRDATGTSALKLSATTKGRLVLNEGTIKRLYETVPPDSGYWLSPGDVLIQRANSLNYIGRTAIYEGPPSEYVYPDLMMRVRISDDPTRQLIWRYLNSMSGNLYFRSRATGTAGNMPKINARDVKEMPFPLPPLHEQRRIVAKIEDLTARSRRAREALEKISPLLGRFRQSVLAAAFRGDLTAEWRKQHPDVEPASVLLVRIRAERRRRWEKAELAKMRAKGKEPADDRWKAKYEEPAPVDASGLPELPEGWVWVVAEDLTAPKRPIIYGIIKPGPDTPGGVPYVRVTEMKNGTIDVGSLRRCHRDRASKFGRATLQAGDVLVSKDGTIGKVAMVPPELEGGNITQHLVRLSPSVHVHGQYVARMIEAPTCQAWMTGETKGIGLQGVNVRDFRLMPIPLPPLQEQRRVAEVLDHVLGSLADLTTDTRAASIRLDSLDQAILAKAFRGELVPQDPSDEPASVLLERIRAEREAAEANKPKRGGRGRRGTATKPPKKEPAEKAPPSPAKAPEKIMEPGAKVARTRRTRTLLEALKRDALHRIADTEGVYLPDRRSLAGAVEAITKAGLDLDAILAPLKRDELKTVCRALGLDDGGEQKDEIRERILSSSGRL